MRTALNTELMFMMFVAFIQGLETDNNIAKIIIYITYDPSIIGSDIFELGGIRVDIQYSQIWLGQVQ